MPSMARLGRFFTVEEFACKCGCGTGQVSPRLIGKLDTAREIAQVPFVVRSGLRCAVHNFKVGGKASSAHLTGQAVDIATPDSHTRYRVLVGAIMAGFTRIGWGADFLHLDVDESKPQEVTFDY